MKYRPTIPAWLALAIMFTILVVSAAYTARQIERDRLVFELFNGPSEVALP